MLMMNIMTISLFTNIEVYIYISNFKSFFPIAEKITVIIEKIIKILLNFKLII